MIRILEEHIANKIAAGEVITSPVAVVKELVENAIDAGADSITCEIRNGGKTYIRVTDNGSGIPSDQVELAFEKHATGKIATEEDLDRIGTLGFRGEALGSIATVSNVEMITRTEDETVGTQLIMESGKVVDKKGIGCEVGTTMIVKDLFHNLPARLKFMRSDRGEGALVHDLISKIAVAYPEIRVKFISNDKVLFNTRGNGDGALAVHTVYGSGLNNKLIPVEAESVDGTMSLRAYVSAPMENRPSKKNQIFFVNGRLVTDKRIENAVQRAYKNRMFPGRYPIVYLFLEVAPNKLDVNIHPSKDEVRFYEPEKVEDLIEKSIYEALQTQVSVPPIRAGEPGTGKESKAYPRFTETLAAEGDLHDSGAFRSEPEKTTRTLPSGSTDPFLAKAKDSKQVDVNDILSTLRNREEKKTEEEKKPERPAISEEPLRPFDFHDLRPLGIIFDTYILATDDEAFYMIDQHAAHERVLFEQIRDRFEAGNMESQMLMVPVTFDVHTTSDDWQERLMDIGFEIEEFGPGTYIVRAIPMAFTDIDIEAFLKDYLDSYETLDPLGEDLYTRIATMACKAAVKGNDKLKDEEVTRLLSDLAECRQPFSCPHGRPTFLRMTKYEIERNFKRK